MVLETNPSLNTFRFLSRLNKYQECERINGIKCRKRSTEHHVTSLWTRPVMAIASTSLSISNSFMNTEDPEEEVKINVSRLYAKPSGGAAQVATEVRDMA